MTSRCALRWRGALAAGLIALLPGVAAASYVVDRLLVGLHEDRSPESPVIKVVPTGADVEVLERTETFVRIRTEDGVSGWVDTSYITEDKPAWLVVAELRATNADRTARLTEAEATVERLQRSLAQHPEAAATPASTTPDAQAQETIASLRAELAEANERARLLKEEAALREIAVRKDASTEIEALRGEISLLERSQGVANGPSSTDLRELQRLAEENQRLKASLDASDDAPAADTSTPRPLAWAWSVTSATWWELGALLSAVVLAFFLGAHWMERSARRRLGGFRL